MSRLRVAAVLLALVAALSGVVLAPAADAAAPDNDNVGAATFVPPDYGQSSYWVDNSDATLESGEMGQDDCGDSIYKTVWFKVKPTNSGTMTIQTKQSAGFGSTDTVLNVWSGPPSAPALGALTAVTCDDQSGGTNFSRVEFTASSAMTYYIQVGYWEEDRALDGPFSVALSTPSSVPPPTNNNLANAVLLATSFATDASTVNATLETNEVGQREECEGIKASVWFKWTAPNTQTSIVETMGGAVGLDTIINVWTSSTPTPSIASLTSAGCADQGSIGNLSRVPFQADSGTAYYIQVAMSTQTEGRPEPGPFQVKIHQAPPPANDNLTTAAAMSIPATVNVENVSATTEPGESASGGDCTGIVATSWFKYFAASSGAVTFDTLATTPSRDTVLAAYSGPASSPAIGTIAPVTPTGCNDDSSPGSRSRLTFPVSAGATYYVQVGSFDSGNTGELRLTAALFTPTATTTLLDGQVTGRVVKLNARVTQASPGDPLTGSVEFFEGAKSLGQVALAGTGHAVKPLNAVAPGHHSYTAAFTSYDFREANSTSQSEGAVVTVDTKTSLAATAEHNSVTLQAVVSSVPSGLTPIGTVNFYEGTILRGTAPLDRGIGALTLREVDVGSHSYSANYIPATQSGYVASTSTDSTVTATQPPPAAVSVTSITAPKQVRSGRAPKVAISVKRGSAAASGLVSVRVGGKLLTTVALADGRVRVRLPRMLRRTRIIVTYLGNATTLTSSARATIRIKK